MKINKKKGGKRGKKDGVSFGLFIAYVVDPFCNVAVVYLRPITLFFVIESSFLFRTVSF